MKSFYALKVIVLVAVLSGLNLVGFSQTTTFNYSGAVSTWTCPAGLTAIYVDMQGARGGVVGGTALNASRAGYGGRVQAVMAVTPGVMYYFYVGGVGANGTASAGGAGGFNGGGAGAYNPTISAGSYPEGGGGGGGATDIRVGGSAYANRVVVAGAGGGDGINTASTVTNNENGGDGGGLIGTNGLYTGVTTGTQIGFAGTQTSGGAGATATTPNGFAGGPGYGGAATPFAADGGGGGGGYYGGGGAANGGGGGGSSYTSPTLVSSFTHTQGYNSPTTGTSTGNGVVTIYSTSLSIGGTVTTAGTFGNLVVGTVSAYQTITISSSNAVAPVGAPTVNVTAPAGFLVSASASGPYTSSITVPYTPPNISQTVYVEFAPTAYSTYSANVLVSAGGAFVNVPVTGTGIFPCSGTPSIGSASFSGATTTSAGPGTLLTLSTPAITSVGGITYQWYSWSFGSGGTAPFFAPIAGATTATVTTYTTPTPFNNTWYYCVVGCSYSGSSATSNTIEATTTTSNPCHNVAGATTSTVSATSTAGCSPSFSTTVFLETTTNTDNSFGYQWEVSTTGSTSGFAPISGATNPYFTPTITGTVWIRDSITCPAPLYYGVDASTPALQLTLNGLPSAITGSTNICTGTATQFSSTPSGGTWAGNNPTLFSIGASTGIASGIAPGLGAITYTLPTGCTATTTVVVNLGASTIAGNTNICPGTTTTLSDLVSGGAWSSSATAAATVNGSTGVVTGVAAGTSNITYTLPDACSATLPVTVNSLPAAISGAAAVCVGSTTLLSDATAGGTWSSSDAFRASIGASSGIATGVAAGHPTISYTLSTGCLATMAFTVNDVPAAITGTNSVCVGSNTTLADAGVTGTWSSSNTSLATVGTSGVVTGVAAGTPVITITRTSTGCFNTAAVTVNPLPLTTTVTESSGGAFCPGGAGVHIGLNNSYDGTEYYLHYGGASVDSLPGATSALDFGLYNGLGTYSVTATNMLTGCSAPMAGSATVSNYPLPTVDTVKGGGSYCAGGTGVNVYMNSSDLGVTYQLYVSGVATGAPVAGTGTNLSFGLQTAAGLYTATALNITTLCTNTMTGGATVNILPVPIVDTVSAGGNYCLGGTGVDVSLNNSTLGIYYKLYNNGSYVNTILSVGGGPIDFGNQTAAGNYTIVALNNSDHCTSNMADTAKINIDSLPAVYSTTGGGNYCYGSGGKHVGVAYSVVGTNYLLYSSGTLVSTIAGSDAGLDFGLQATPGVYNVVAKYASTGCQDTMSGAVAIGIDTLPTAYNVMGTAGYCSGGSGVPVSLSGSGPGSNLKYRLYLNGVNTGEMLAGTGSSLAFGLQAAAGTYKVVVLDTITTCMRTMNDSAIVTINPNPTAYGVGGGGNYCTGGTGVPVMLTNSQTGTNYQLIHGGTAVAAASGSTGSALNFGLQTLTGAYTVMATTVATGCTSEMAGSASIGTLPLPAQYMVSGGGTDCAGGAGFPVSLAVSTSNTSYRLYNSGYVGAALLGTGSALNFGIQTAAGTYKVIGTNVTTGCADTMLGSAVIVVNPLPTRYTVTGGGAFCAGSSGAPVGLSGSDATSGTAYQLYEGGLTVGSSMAGTGHALSFGMEGTGGTYWVTATSGAGCTDTMLSSAMVTANPAPIIYDVTGGGSFCAGDTGVHIFLSGSNTFVNYQVYRAGSIPVGGIWAGTGLPLDLGLDSTGGTYTVTGVSVLTGCTSTMSGSALLVVNPLVMPSVTISTGVGDTVCTGSSVTFTPTATNGGSSPMYQWAVNTMPAGSGATYSYTPANGDVVSVTLTSDANCVSPATAANSIVMTVSPNETPVVTITTASLSVCPRTSVTFNSSATYTGTAPAYSWSVNGHGVGVTTPSYTYVPSNNDAVELSMTSNFPCLTRDFVLSNPLIMTADTPAIPSFAINGAVPITHLQPLTLSASVSNGTGVSLSYQWSVNSVDVPRANAATFTSNTFNNGDVVCCSIYSSNSCGTSAKATECATILVNANLGVSQVNGGSNISVVPNPNKGAFTIKGTLGVTTDEEVALEVTDMLGQVVYSSKVIAQSGVINEQVSLSGALANGMYLLNVHSGTENSVFHFVIGQ